MKYKIINVQQTDDGFAYRDADSWFLVTIDSDDVIIQFVRNADEWKDTITKNEAKALIKYVGGKNLSIKKYRDGSPRYIYFIKEYTVYREVGMETKSEEKDTITDVINGVVCHATKGFLGCDPIIITKELEE